METHNHRWNPVDSVHQQYWHQGGDMFQERRSVCGKDAFMSYIGYTLPHSSQLNQQPMSEDDPAISVWPVHASLRASSPVKSPHQLTRSIALEVSGPTTNLCLNPNERHARYLSTKLLNHRCSSGRDFSCGDMHAPSTSSSSSSSPVATIVSKEFISATFFVFYGFLALNAKSATLIFNNP
jgi:hypothetical protein